MTDPVGHPPSYARVSLAIMTSGREVNLLGNIHGGEDIGGGAPDAEVEIRRAPRLAKRQEIESG